MRKTTHRVLGPASSRPHRKISLNGMTRFAFLCVATGLVAACSAGMLPSRGDVKNALEDVANQISMPDGGLRLSPIQIRMYHQGAQKTVVLGCKPDTSTASATGLYVICDLANPSDNSTATFQLKKEGPHWYFTDYPEVARWETDVGVSRG
ncbi:MAG TPA: hypothetical protein VFL63_02195 [Rhodanobacteraceae bacterium]|nr:hypothetical protein [Rhodanobacteraceae bacterium]